MPGDAFDFKAINLAPSSRFEAEVDRVIKGLLLGKTNNIGTVTLAAAAATTTLTDPRITVYSAITLVPQTANAQLALSTVYIPRTTQKNGETVINHANDAATDKTFTYVITG